ncbi:MAG: ATP-binding cassette domain-containing protein [candidate division WOR-3 bacterium]
MIRLTKISKMIRGEPVLRDVNIEVPDASCCCVLGRSGAGKTVLLKIIAGLIVPDSGEVIFDGRTLKSGIFGNNQEIIREIGFLFQHGALFDGMDVGENVALPLRERNCIPAYELKERVQKTLVQVGLPDSCHLRVPELSGGMIKLVALARALITEPRYLFLDEPTGGLDPVSRERVINIVRSLRAAGKTVVAVTHDLDLARQMADRIYLIRDGKLHLAMGEVRKEDYE